MLISVTQKLFSQESGFGPGIISCNNSSKLGGQAREGLNTVGGRLFLDNLAEIEIILIEDNPFDAELILRALNNQGLDGRVKVFPDGVEALDFLIGNSERNRSASHSPRCCPKVIFLDLKLPKMSGLEVLSQIKKDARTRSIPVVMLTSSQEESDIAESYKQGVNSYIVKPVDYDEFCQVVVDMGLYWLQRNKARH